MQEETLEIIKELMEQLQSEMKPGVEDFEERLGRHKPGVEIVKVEGKLPMDGESMEVGMDDDMDDKKEELMLAGMDSEMSPKDDLKRRLMKLRA